MKYLSILIIVLFTASCSNTKKAIEAQQESIEVLVPSQTPNVIKHHIKPETQKTTEDNNSIEISLGENGTVSDDGISETTEIIYTEAFDHALFSTLLKKYVTDSGIVNYKGFKSESKALQNYINLLKLYQPNDAWSKNDKLAYWINAYNALTIDLIIKNYPTKSIKDIKDPWDQRLWKFGNTWQNLNAIEHKILRNMNEPRIHFAIVCASVSCPKLQNEAFTASNLNTQLTKATKEFLNDTSKNKISEDRIELSKIFKWFKKDFENNGSLIDFLNQYLDIIISSKAKKNFMNYSWDLND